MPDRYRIFRYYIRDDRREIIKDGLSWDEAMEHLADPETKFDSATSEAARERTEKNGPWWDCWDRIDHRRE